MCKWCGEQVTRYNRDNRNIWWKWWKALEDHLANLFVVPFCLGSICMIYVVHCCTWGAGGVVCYHGSGAEWDVLWSMWGCLFNWPHWKIMIA
jgi:hypothetical protein